MTKEESGKKYGKFNPDLNEEENAYLNVWVLKLS